MRAVQARMPLFAELLPLSLEEIFISETEVKGYDIKKLIF
jgi:ABC-2 type transport system ATP-binding protein